MNDQSIINLYTQESAPWGEREGTGVGRIIYDVQ